MGKLVMWISAGVTGFILALTAGAIYAYRSTPAPAVAVQQSAANEVASTLQLAAPAPVAAAPVNVAPQDAASIAAKSINRTDLYSVELADYQGVQAYKVTFSSGDIVYVSLQGQVLGTQAPPAPVFVSQSSGGGGGGGGGGGHNSGGSHEDGGHEDHEGGDN